MVPTQKKTHAVYLLRNIDRALWRQVRVRAVHDGLSLRDVLLGFLKAYAQGRSWQ